MISVHLCEEGTMHLQAMIDHVQNCSECQQEIKKKIDGFPMLKMILGNPSDLLSQFIKTKSGE